MDLSALIFVALAVAWAAYLVPKAIKHHDEVQRTRSVERFSRTMRVLARREPVSSRDSRLVVTPGRAPSVPVIETKGPAPTVVVVAARRAAANRAARRRRNVLSVILLGLVVVTALAAASVFSWWYVAVPGAVLVAWLVACRLMVRQERGLPLAKPSRPARTTPAAPGRVVAVEDAPTTDVPVVPAALPQDDEHAPVAAAPDVVVQDPSMWDMVPVTLPTYVSKPAAARRTVQTIDLDSTGVWTSGRTDEDAAIARAADESAREEQGRGDNGEQRRAVGS
ncbi:hypothetical protein [Nocardioides solisilvae]|uniref:divisome protein SepX/GlpR n=1 Tax=Nocardioides solisilvae TaxID=1542435 RepID=UPI000D74805F|nr:hypothetical protein [Nocardioides solisilvae]